MKIQRGRLTFIASAPPDDSAIALQSETVRSSPRPINSQDIIFKDLQLGNHCSLLSFDPPPPLLLYLAPQFLQTSSGHSTTRIGFPRGKTYLILILKCPY
ncbi:hypothetical protein ATANTOWER_022268 [Ataeniobius toweri]|uniref:Uncharacterized protein n=1 Tax=Ataeniobius toweri TaxID=208326 RepID=A0ABU7AL23_9TELE|nr:hypothetical protein [Ataeniobius toweri]